MSNRTIVEFNHDYAHVLDGSADARERFGLLVLRALSSGAAADWKMLSPYGVRRIVMAHHSDDRRVIVNGTEYTPD